jgi:hypothetical protein
VTRDGVTVLSLVLLSASWALAHLLLLLQVLRAQGLPPWARLLSLVPVATPVLGVRAGLRTLPLLWTLLGAGYLAVRALY